MLREGGITAGPPAPVMASLGATVLRVLQAATAMVLKAEREPATMPLALLTRRRVSDVLLAA